MLEVYFLNLRWEKGMLDTLRKQRQRRNDNLNNNFDNVDNVRWIELVLVEI